MVCPKFEFGIIRPILEDHPARSPYRTLFLVALVNLRECGLWYQVQTVNNTHVYLQRWAHTLLRSNPRVQTIYTCVILVAARYTDYKPSRTIPLRNNISIASKTELWYTSNIHVSKAHWLMSDDLLNYPLVWYTVYRYYPAHTSDECGVKFTLGFVLIPHRL